MRKVILKCSFAPGDTILLTAAVRDLHACYRRRFVTDVRTPYPELWLNNPYLNRLDEKDAEVAVIDCHYPLINESNQAPFHVIHGFIEFLNDHLNLRIRPTAFKGDLQLSEPEKSWFSQVYELTGEDTPFWVIVAGGKYDVTIKWWDVRRYQAVVDHFQGRIQFVQVEWASAWWEPDGRTTVFRSTGKATGRAAVVRRPARCDSDTVVGECERYRAQACQPFL